MVAFMRDSLLAATIPIISQNRSEVFCEFVAFCSILAFNSAGLFAAKCCKFFWLRLATVVLALEFAAANRTREREGALRLWHDLGQRRGLSWVRRLAPRTTALTLRRGGLSGSALRRSIAGERARVAK
jgi:hypothetical protein